MAKDSLREQIAQEFINALSEDRIPWKAMWKGQRPVNVTTGKNYRGVNALWLSYIAGEKGYKDPRWCTFKQAKDHDWHVKKDEHGTRVEFWSVYDKKQRKAIDFREANKIIADDPDREKDMRITSRCYIVFNGEQIEGIPALEQGVPVVGIESIRAQRDVLLANMGLSFHEGGDRAFYRPSDDSITMPPDVAFQDAYGYMSTFLHECGHATGHTSRMNRDLSGMFGSESYAKEELRAEISSAFTSQALGLDVDGTAFASEMDNHKAYIQSWISVIQDKPNELFAAIKDAEKISDYLIEKGEFSRLERLSDEKLPSLDENIEEANKVLTEKPYDHTVIASRDKNPFCELV